MKNIYILGSANMDLVIQVDKMPQQGETLLGTSFMMNPGGKGANQAVAVAKSGGRAKFVGAVGNAFSDELLDTLTKYNVDISNVKKFNDVASGVAVIVMTNGDNRIIVDAGANGKVDTDLAKAALQNAQAGDYLIAQLETPVSTIVETFKFAKKQGLVTCLNTAPALLLPQDIFAHIDYICLNETETMVYTGIKPLNNTSAKEAASLLIAKGVKNVIITLGEKGAILVSQNEQIYVPSFKVPVVDTTAAGDTFFGALITRLAAGEALKASLRFASAAAALCITKDGAQQAIPTYEETVTFLRTQHD